MNTIKNQLAEEDAEIRLRVGSSVTDSGKAQSDTKPLTSREHSTLAGLRQRFQDIREILEKAEAYLDDQKKWRHVASLVADIQLETETCDQQINELL